MIQITIKETYKKQATMNEFDKWRDSYETMTIEQQGIDQ